MSDANREATPRPGPGAFEESLKRLEEIVRELERGDLTLADSLRLFEEGTRLTRELHGTLDQAERTIETLVRGASGEAGVEPFPTEGRP